MEREYNTGLCKGQGMLPETLRLLQVWEPGMSATQLAEKVRSQGLISKGTAQRVSDIVTAPRDYQTVLEQDPERFQRTGRFWNVAGKDRRIYRETDTGRYFYVDEGHPGLSAHLEVFDQDGKHLGEANISSGSLDASKKDRDKYITI